MRFPSAATLFSLAALTQAAPTVHAHKHAQPRDDSYGGGGRYQSGIFYVNWVSSPSPKSLPMFDSEGYIWTPALRHGSASRQAHQDQLRLCQREQHHQRSLSYRRVGGRAISLPQRRGFERHTVAWQFQPVVQTEAAEPQPKSHPFRWWLELQSQLQACPCDCSRETEILQELSRINCRSWS